MTKQKANPRKRTSAKKTGNTEPKARASRKRTAAADKPADQTPVTTPATVTDLNEKREAVKPSAIKAETGKTIEADPVGDVVGIPFSAAQLSAAVMCSAKKNEQRFSLIGVYLHVIEGRLRMVSTDGHRLLVQTVAAVDEKCPIGEQGVILPREEIERVLKFTGKDGETAIAVEIAENDPRVTLRSSFGSFTMRPVDGAFPDYARILQDAGDVFAAAEREPLDTAAIKSDYMKSAGMIANQLGAEAVFAHQGDANRAVVFTFAGLDGAIYVQMPVRSEGHGISGGTAALIGKSGLASTVTALRAHETRNRKAAKGTTDEALAAKLTAKADEFKQRIDAILAGVEKALPAPTATGTK